MKHKQMSKIAFLIMGLFIIEIIALVQAIFSEQIIKFNLDRQVEYASEMILSQFMASYSANDSIQDSVTNLGYSNFDENLTQLYKNIRETVSVNPNVHEKKYISKSGDYQIEIQANSAANRNVYKEQLGLNIESISEYKILSYEMKQSERLLMERRLLIGLSKDRKWIFNIEISQNAMKQEMNKTNRSLAGLLNSAYYFSDKTGNFYVVSTGGNIVYQGGLEKNASYFTNLDLNTNQRIIDLIRQEKNIYQRVIYKKATHINRSIMRVIYNEESNLYFVYELDQSKVFGTVEKQLKQIWMGGLVILVGTFGCIYIAWASQKKKQGGSL